MTKIYLIRHAEAEGNLYRRIQGHYNGDVTIRGHKQIEALADRFKDVHIDALYASDLRRTQITAGAILKYHHLPLNIEPRLKEVNMGAWEDMPWGNATFDTPEQICLFANNPAKWNVPGREDFYHLRDRICGIIRELAERHDGQTIACFSHGMAIRTLISAAKGVPSERIHDILHGDNTCVTQLNVEKGHIEVEYYNDNSHLSEELSTFSKQSWWKHKDSPDPSNLRFLPLNPMNDGELYCNCYADAWQATHGNLKGFSPKPYLAGARKVASKDPQTLMATFCGNRFAGIVELDPARMADESAGWISLCYLTPEFRGMHYGIQLIGHAVSFFRKQGRNCLRLHVAECNERAIRFYESVGFRHAKTITGSLSPLCMMEKSI